MEQLVNFIIRPPRADYSPKNDLLDQEFMLKGRWFQRKDLEVINGHGKVLQCSHYMPLEIPEGKTLPCVIYCHGNSGCRADASEAAIILLPSNITVFTLDFSGSGLSEGEHVTLGWNEKDDLKAVVNHLREDGHVSCIGLWGRSMGAVTSLMYGAEDPSIAGMVLDSPFSNLVELMMELVDTYKYPLPKFTVKLAIQHMRKVIKKKANFDIMDLDTIQVAKCSFVPVLFGHATDDDFIQPHHSDRIYEYYVGDKNIIKFDGDHNSPRPEFYFDSITIFFHNVLNPPKDASDEYYFHATHNFFEKDNWDSGHGLDYRSHNLIATSPELAASSTEDAITQLRSRRPMSRTEVPSDISSQEKKHESEGNGSEPDLDPSSSSSLYDVNLSNGYLHSPFSPTTADDDYVEYSFDTISGTPCSMEDEEMMVMEAIIKSLRDMEARQPQEDDLQANAVTAPPDASDVMKSPIEPNGPMEMVPSSMTSGNKCKTTIGPVLEAPGSCTDSARIKNSTINLSSSVSGCSSMQDADMIADMLASSMTSSTKCKTTIESVLEAPGSCTDSASIKNSTSSLASPVIGCSSTKDADATADTLATLVVEKGPTSHILDGLTHRWGINFFRNGR